MPADAGHRPIPDWYANAKLGIFVHWGLYSVPAWAPTTGAFDKVTEEQGWSAWFRDNPYAEWYRNTLHISGSPTANHHAATYGPDMPYEDFAPAFSSAALGWNPVDWAELFRSVGARYVVLTTKHHDGFLLWPSEHRNPHLPGWQTSRDLVGQLTKAVRDAGIRMGLYYSGGLDWRFNSHVIQDLPDLWECIPQCHDYVAYVDAQWRELIQQYQPSILWNDIGMPWAFPVQQHFDDYYAAVPDGLVNDRFAIGGGMDDREHAAPFDISTPEYRTYSEITPEKWESTRGIGFSFGYNRNEGDESLLSVRDLVHLLVDIVSKNGNLLLNTGPMADGTIPPGQRHRLLGLGAWLRTNGEAIFETQPWHVAEGETGEGIPLRFTQCDGALYAILLERPGGTVTLALSAKHPNTDVRLLGHDASLTWESHGDQITMMLPPNVADQPAHAFRIAPAP
jgi:alpha-L-fucosidase